ncbi:MAG: AraC family transcriptional regulator [Ruminococcaceae bacterium]|nr:AraC family transcriptional regulator [Oscillospiraceae bacterium]
MVDVEKVFSVKGFYSAFRFDWDFDFIFSGERHDFWEIVFVDSGKVEVTEGENVYLLSQGDVILHAPMEFHSIRSAGGTSPTGYVITFEVKGELPSELKNGIFTLSDTDKEEYIRVCRKTINYHALESCPSIYQGQEVGSLWETFLIKLAKNTSSAKIFSGSGVPDYKKLVSEMLLHVCDNYTLSDFAATCNMSVSNIKHLFNRYANVSPKFYYDQLRADHAAELLLTGMTVAEVSEKMNFSSAGYFTVFFKRYYGKNPLQYQKNN